MRNAIFDFTMRILQIVVGVLIAQTIIAHNHGLGGKYFATTQILYAISFFAMIYFGLFLTFKEPKHISDFASFLFRHGAKSHE
ncbi:MAG: hypothetical protein PHW12_00695 [Smithella sp.]|nr:hypothetical protein [Smithella sp.]MDD5672580.1 hypothetical protein [Chitinivibrionales bacterium]